MTLSALFFLRGEKMTPKNQIIARQMELAQATVPELKDMWAEDSLSIVDYAFIFPRLIDLVEMLSRRPRY